MIHIDEVQNYFDSNFSNFSVETDADANNFRAKLTRDNTSIEIRFDFKKQLFTFDNLRGKSQTITSMDALELNIETYFYVETDFKPKAQAVGDTFKSQKLSNFSVSLKGNRGNATLGFTLIYAISGTNQEVHVQVEDKDRNIFKASLVEISSGEDGDQLENLLTYMYIIDEVGNISIIPTFDYYSDKILSDYSDSSSVDITKLGDSKFRFSFEDSLVIEADIIINENYELKYIVNKVSYNGSDLPNATLGLIDVNNIFNITELYSNYNYLIQDFEEFEEETSEEETSEEETSKEETSEEESSEGVEDEESTKEVGDDELNKEELTEKVEESQSIQGELEDDLNVIILIYDNTDCLKYVRFILKNKYYDMSIKKAKELGIPINNVIDKEKQVLKRGMLATPMELANRIFAEDISDNDSLCNELINKLYS